MSNPERCEGYKKVYVVLSSAFPNVKDVLKGSVCCTLYLYIFGLNLRYCRVYIEGFSE